MARELGEQLPVEALEALPGKGTRTLMKVLNVACLEPLLVVKVCCRHGSAVNLSEFHEISGRRSRYAFPYLTVRISANWEGSGHAPHDTLRAEPEN